MKSDSQVITSCVIPINVTGVQFHRDSSVHCSLIHSQSVLQRRRKLRRRKTVIGIPRSVQQDLDSDESPGARERTVVVRCNAALCSEDLCCRLNTKKDSGCQTEDFLVCAPSHWRVQYQRGQQGVSSALVPLSLSTGNISSLLDTSEHNNAMFSSSLGVRLRSRSQPREGRRLIEVHHHSEEEEEEELSPSETDDFLSGLGELKEKGGGGADDQSQPDHPLASLKYQQRTGSPWLERGQSRLPRKVDMGSCEMSSSSDTFSSPLHSTSTRRVVGCQMDHKDDHQSSSGNWSGSSSTCPSHTSETLPPAASPRLTGSSHCDSELSLNTGPHATDDPTPILILDPYQTDRQLDDAGVSMASDGEWSYPHPDSRLHDFSPERSREGEGSLGYPSFSSMATCESFITDKPPSEKADTVSYYSIDNEGYYTSMHFDCGLKGSKSFMYNYSDCGQEHMTLGRRCLTLRKPKAKPSAPRRSSSLRKISGGGNSPDDTEPKNRSGQQRKSCSRERRLQLDLEGSLGHPNLPDPHPALGHLEDPVLGGEVGLGGLGLEQDPLEPLLALETWRREDTEEMPGSGLFGSSDRGSYKDEGAVQSDYADLWLVNDLKSNTDPYRSLSNSSTATGTTVIECIKSQESSESQTSQSGSTPSLPSVEDFKMSSLPSVEGDFKMSSPERLAGLVSPSSGYSSQSETPTSSFPCAFFPSPLSPTNQKRKPKIPERKSSLSITSTRDLELPVIPPSHQNLSALYSLNPTSPPPVSTKPPGHRNQLYLLQQSKQTAAASARAEARVATETSSSLPMTITPTVLHSVQLRSVGKQGEGSPARPGPDVATRPKCPTVNISPSSSSRSPESTTRNPPAYNSQVPPSQQYCESLLAPSEGPVSRDPAGHSSVRYRQDRHPAEAQWRTTSFRQPVDQTLADQERLPDQERLAEEDHTIRNQHQPLLDQHQPLLDQHQPLLDQHQPLTDQQSLLDQEVCQRGAQSTGVTPGQELEEQKALFPGSSSSLEAEQYRPLPPQPSELQRPEDLSVFPGQHSLATISESRDEVPVKSDQSETLQAYPISDVAGRQEEYSRPSDNSIFSLSEETKAEGDVFLSSTKACTTEELFAMIHRSRRKVLGRKDSGELSARSSLCAQVTPPGNTMTSLVNPSTSTTPTGSQKAPGPIYRSLKKSSTSHEEFKLLLLKKGSRSDSSYRMSATEILKSPISPNAPGDPLAEKPLSPPPGTEKLPSPFTEGFSPKGLSTAACPRQSRSRIPPPPTSSRYSIRSRQHPAPMQAISEGETENSDRSPS
ncbi:actin remodeling regulator NHS-like isoform X2 [Oncorhynchus clarkii lewisi]